MDYGLELEASWTRESREKMVTCGIASKKMFVAEGLLDGPCSPKWLSIKLFVIATEKKTHRAMVEHFLHKLEADVRIPNTHIRVRYSGTNL